MYKFKNIIKNNDLFKLLKLSINLCLIGTNRNYRRFFNFFFVSTLTSIFESLPIIIIIPFIGIISNPERAWENNLVRSFGKFIDINNSEELLLPLTIVFLLVVILSAVIRLINVTYLARFNASVGKNISKNFFKKTIYAPYEFFITNNSSELLNSFTSKIETCVFSIQAFLTFINSLFISFFILITILLVNFKITLLLILVFSTAYIFIAYFKNKKLKKISRINSIVSSKRMKIIQESILSIRELILNGNQKNFLNKFNLYANKRESALVETYLTSLYPKYLVEAVGLSLIGLIAFFLRSYEDINPLPILGALTLGLQRLLPQLQTLFTSFANVTTSYEMSNNIFSLISSIEAKNQFPGFDSKKIIKLESIQLKNIAYKYPNTQNYALKNINLKINKGDKIGIIGSTGAGKSTIVELITTLLEPSKGEIFFNGYEISHKTNRNKLMSWRKNISYVPQFISLNDSSILENIALGIPSNEIDIEKAKNCAKAALIFDHINSLNKGIFTNIGERGIKLSGGQIQRIGIARALYTNSAVLILDEATSALDTKTEEKLVESIAKINKDLTIIAISHRLATLKNYERLIKVQRNTITEINSLEG